MHPLIDWLAKLPLEWFMFFGAFVEELISPIPSFLIFLPAGASLQAQGGRLWYMIVLGAIAGLGHILATLILYWLANKFRGHLYRGTRNTWLGVRKIDIELLRKKMQGRWSWWLWFAAWALPIFPGAPLSLIGGFLRVPLMRFITATYFGSIINSLVYLYIGYFGLQALSTLNTLEATGRIVSTVLIVTLLAWLVRRHYKLHPKKHH